LGALISTVAYSYDSIPVGYYDAVFHRRPVSRGNGITTSSVSCIEVIEHLPRELSLDIARESKRAATLASQLALGGIEITDPMSGYFMMDRALFLAHVEDLCGKGFKILLDMLSTARNSVRVVEIPYNFRSRLRGTSKLRVSVVLEFLILLLDKTLGRFIPYPFLLFVTMGCAGAVFHLLILGLLLYRIGVGFAIAQGTASLVAMIVNFALNNVFTHYDRRLAGIGFLKGLSTFVLVCAIGAFANIQVANYFFKRGIAWWLCGLLGGLIGAVWNYAVSATLVWKRK